MSTTSTARFTTPARKHSRDHVISPYVPTLVLNGDGTIEHITNAARRLLEYEPDEHIDPCFFSHIHGKNLYQVMRDVADMVRYGKPKAQWLLRLRTGKGRWRWYRVKATNKVRAPGHMITVSLDDLQEW